jgi:hypothetical protein
LQITFIRLFAVPQTEEFIVELVLLEAREFKEPRCREMSKIKKKKRGGYEVLHFFALLNRIKILPGTRMERLKC